MYEPNIECTWMIRVEEGMFILLNFIDLDLGQNGMSFYSKVHTYIFNTSMFLLGNYHSSNVNVCIFNGNSLSIKNNKCHLSCFFFSSMRHIIHFYLQWICGQNKTAEREIMWSALLLRSKHI